MGGTALIERARQESVRIVRNLPDAHASWQFWRNARFRKSVGDLVDLLYCVDVSTLNDDQLDYVIEACDFVLQIIKVHTSRLTSDPVRDPVDLEYFARLRDKVCVAREGLQLGLHPDPTKRPSDDELLDTLAAVLEAKPLNLRGHKGCANVGTA